MAHERLPQLKLVESHQQDGLSVLYNQSRSLLFGAEQKSQDGYDEKQTVSARGRDV